MIEKVFILNSVQLDIRKAFGHKECVKKFKNQEECDAFMKRVEEKDKIALEELNEKADVLLDEYDINDYVAWDNDWEVL